jgi:hypothetical protein
MCLSCSHVPCNLEFESRYPLASTEYSFGNDLAKYIRHDYLYDSAGNILRETEYTCVGQKEEQAACTTYAYSHGRLSKAETRFTSSLQVESRKKQPEGYDLICQYDESGLLRRKTRLCITGTVAENDSEQVLVYDACRRLISVTMFRQVDKTPTAMFVKRITYNEQGQIAKAQTDSPIAGQIYEEYYFYDNRGKIERRTVKITRRGINIDEQEFQYKRDSMGRLSEVSSKNEIVRFMKNSQDLVNRIQYLALEGEKWVVKNTREFQYYEEELGRTADHSPLQEEWDEISNNVNKVNKYIKSR